MRRIISYYINDMKLSKKLVISHLLLVLLPLIIISLLFYSKLTNIIHVNSLNSEQQALLQTSDYVEYVISQLRNSSSSVVNNPLFSDLSALTAMDLQSKLKDPDFRLNLHSFLSFTENLIDHDVVTDLKIYVDDSYQPILNSNSFPSQTVFCPIQDIASSRWFDKYQKDPSLLSDPFLICPKDYLTAEEKKKSGSFSVVQRTSWGLDSQGTQKAAYIVLYFSKDNIQNAMLKTLLSDRSVTYLINGQNNLVGASDYKLANEYLFRYQALDQLLPGENTWAQIPFGANSAYVSYKNIPKSDWKLISVIPTESLFRQNTKMYLEFICAYLAVAGFVCLLSITLSASITRRIHRLEQQMAAVQTGQPKPLLGTQGFDEIGGLMNTYNDMATEIQDLMEEQSRTAEELKNSELKALQAQINPHFLYNTLDMINWLSQKGQSKEVTEAIHALSRFYKLTLSKGSIVVSIQSELEHVSLYVKLQNMRYPDKIGFLVDIPDEFLDYAIPKIVFQPIVENAIQHGLFEKEDKAGTIVITAWQEGDMLVFQICDDGAGMSQSQLQSILNGNVESRHGSSIGVINTHRRLQIFYGDSRYGLSYESTPGKGTDVTICIPIREL